MLTPSELLKRVEAEGDYTTRLGLMEDAKLLPFGAVWDHYCQLSDVPADNDWLAQVKAYERAVQAKRG
jgi:L-rhamnose isomerase